MKLLVLGTASPSPSKTPARKKKRSLPPKLPPDWMAPISPTGILCQREGCTQWASRGSLETGPQWCYQHMKSDSMEMWKRLCGQPKCSLQALYGLPGQAPTRCATHKKKDMDLRI